MKRVTALVAVVGLVGVLVTAIPAPAGAADVAPPCTEGSPDAAPLTTVWVDAEGKVHVNPTGPGTDVQNVADWAPGWAVYWAFCVEGILPTEPAWCLVNQAWAIATSMDPVSFYLRYVYYDGREIIVDRPLLVSDALGTTACLP